MNELKPILEQTFGSVPEGYDDEAKAASFIAGLFLTHRGFASITQDSVPDGEIFLEDSWPQIKTFEEINALIETQQAAENERIQEQDSGSVRHAKLRAEKARSAEEDSIRKQERALAKQQKEQAVVEVPESKDIEEQSYDNHEWLVE